MSSEPASGPGERIPWHAFPVTEVLDRLGASRAGLSDEEVARRLARHGPNALAEAQPIRPLAILLAQFRSLLIALLAGAAAVSAALGEWLDASAIAAIVLLNAAIGFYQEYGAERSIAALRKLTAPRAKVRRAGSVRALAAVELVPGDVVLLEAGDLVPTDLRLLDAASLRCNEAALTGESEPVSKRAERALGIDVPLGDRVNLAFLGTSVVGGTGEGVVVATGMGTEFGHIARLLAGAREEPTPLQRRLEALGRVLVWASLAIVALLFGVGLLRRLPALELFLTSISLAVAAVPEGLPAVVTVALAVGVTRMARRRALIRRLPAVETLGEATVICSDKTGTLTVGEMTVRALWTAGAAFDVTGEGYAPAGELRAAEERPHADAERRVHDLLETLVGCNDAYLVEESGVWKAIGDPTEAALLAAGAKLGIRREDLERERPRVRTWPFDSERKRMSVARKQPGGEAQLLVKGAPDVLLERCTRFLGLDGPRPLGAVEREAIVAAHAALTGRALRVLGAARRELEPEELGVDDPETLERDLLFVGLTGMYDPPRPEARRAVGLCREAGIRVVMITGDHPRTALAVARELDIAGPADLALSGSELDALSDEALGDRVRSTAVYARVRAEHKLRIVRAWQAHGDVVAMTGDGVNDAPAIRGADIGIAMGITGTEVTKEASDMIVTDDNFASIVAAVEEGRGVYDNVRKTLQYLLAGNAGELLLMAACIAAGLPVPLLPIHLLWINLVTDGLPALCLATDPLDPDLMRRPPRARDSLTSRRFALGLLSTGLLTAGASLAAYLWALRFASESEARTYAFATLVFAEILRAFGARSETKAVWEIGLFSNLRLAAVAAATVAFQIASHHFAPLRSIFDTTPLGWAECSALLGVAAVPLLALELTKLARRPHTSAA